MENGTQTIVEGKEQEIKAEDNWKYEFNGLAKYDESGKEIIYTVVESQVTGYEPSYETEENNKNIINITNKRDVYYVSGTKEIIGVKVKDNQTGAFVEVNPDTFSVSVGDIVKYEITMKNEGNTDLENIVIKDNKKVTLTNVIAPETMNTNAIEYKEYDANSNLVQGLTGKLKPGKTVKVQVTYKLENNEDIQDVSKLKNEATVSADKTNTEKPTEEINVAHVPSVAIEKTSIKINEKEIKDNDRIKIDGKDVADIKATVGDVITYELKVTNTGDVTINNVKVFDDRTVTYDKEFSDILDAQGNGITLKPGETKTIQVKYTVTKKDINDNINTIENIAHVSAKYDNEEVTPSQDNDIITEKDEKPSIDVTKTSSQPKDKKLLYNDEIKYTIKASNTSLKDGKVTITDSKLKEAIEKGYVSAPTVITVTETTTIEGKTTRKITVDELAKGVEVKVAGGNEAVIEFTVKVTAKAGTTIKNLATVIGGNNETTDETTNKVEKKIISKKYEQTITSTNIVVALDLSSSMNDNSKLSSAKNALRKFVEEIYKNGNGKDVEIRVVTFNWGSYADYKRYVDTYYDRYNKPNLTNKQKEIVGTKLYSIINSGNYQEQLNKIDSIEIPNYMSTDISAGLNLANAELNNFTNKENNNVVILLGDGKPDTDYTGDTFERAKTVASNLKQKATLYTIGFSMDDSGKQLMKDMASVKDNKSLTYTAENQQELINSFEAITKNVSEKPETSELISEDGIIVINLEKALDPNKKVTINGKEYALNTLPKEVTYNSVEKKIIWDISGYEANADLSIAYVYE